MRVKINQSHFSYNNVSDYPRVFNP
ncbi:MAG: hypothetical protein ACD_22C00136G0001, partial [uncultured bacterium]